MKLKKSQIKELIRHTIVDLTEKTFGSKAQYDAYRKKHNLKPGSKHKVDGKTVTVRDVKKISKSAAKSADKFAAAQNAKLDAAEKAMKKKKVKESKMKRFTVKEVRMWMKKLEENRYKKVYNSDARRVAWMVNNEGVELSEMPKSMSKKWTKAQYGRERYLANEFIKSKSEQMTEGVVKEAISGSDRKIMFMIVRDIIENLKKAGAKKPSNQVGQGVLGVLRAMTYSKDNANYKNYKKYFPKTFNSKLTQKRVAQFHTQTDKVQLTMVKQAMNKVLGEGKIKEHTVKFTKDEMAKLHKDGEIEKADDEGKMHKYTFTEQFIRKQIRETIREKLNEAYRSQSIFFDKKDKSILDKLLKKHKGKFPFNPSGEPVVNWSLNDRGSKGLEWSGIPKAKYNKAVEFFMKNKLNPRG